MSRVTKWKLEKAKVKVVFRLQFHATHIPSSGWEKLFISFIPLETGKITAKTSKANVRNGTCKWADPIYETTRLLLEPRNKQYEDKLYKLVVGMGTSRSSILGEAMINLADYADASDPSAVALPLHGSDSGTVLHVTVQLLTAKTGFREFEQQRARGLQTSGKLNRENEPSTTKSSSSELQISDDHISEVDTKIQLGVESNELPPVEEETRTHEEYSDSQVGCDGSSNASESYYADKHDSSSAHELDSLKSTVSGDLNVPGQTQTEPPEERNDSDHRKQKSSERVHGWSSDYSMDNDLAIAYEENQRLRRSLNMAEFSVSELKLELNALQTYTNEMGTETEKFGRELTVEIASGQAPAKEVMVLQSECLKLKDELEQLQGIKSSSKLTERKMDEWVNGLLLVEDRIKELQEKIFIGFRESDLSFVHLDLEVLLGIVQGLKNGTVEVNTYEPQGPGCTRNVDLIEAKHFELLSQLDEAKAERESLVQKMDQMESYYEALVQELEENQKRILGEFQSLRNEHSICAYTISTYKAETESRCHDMNDQILKLVEENHDLSSVNKELERRAMTAESALKRARLNYSIAVNQLQKDLDTLSSQVSSMFETNQNLIKEAFAESSPPFSHGYEKVAENLQKSDDLKKSPSLREKFYPTVEDELCEICYFDVYSRTLEETLFEVSFDVRKTKEKLSEYAQELEFSKQSRDVLLVRLHTAAEDIHALNEQNARHLTKCNDVQLQNQILEANLESVSRENFILMEKLMECEALLMDYRVFKKKYEAASAEKLELENLLRVQVSDNRNLQNNMLCLKEELETVKAGFHDLAMSKENMQKVLKFIQEKFESMLDSSDKQFGEHLLFSNSSCQDTDLKDIESVVMQLEEVHTYSSEKISCLMEQKKDLENERDMAVSSLSSARSEIDDTKRKFKQGIHDMVAKLDASNVYVDKLQAKLESVSKKSKNSFELWERHVDDIEMFLTYLDSVELELQKISSKDGNFVQEISDLNAMAEELETSKLTVYKLKQEKQDLMMSFEENENSEIAKLMSELDGMKERLKCMNDELVVERGLKNKLEDTIEHLTSELNQERDRSRHFDTQNKELVHFRGLASDRESENSRVLKLLTEHEESLKKLRKEHSSFISLELQLEEMQETMIREDVKLICLKTQYETSIEELVKQLQLSESETRKYKELQMKLHGTEARLNRSLENEARLEAFVAQNTTISELNDALTVELGQLKDKMKMMEVATSHESDIHTIEVAGLRDMLAKSEAEVGQWRELETKLLDTKERLNHCLEIEARYIEENGKLLTTVESLRSELEASIAKNVALSTSNAVLAVEFEQYKDTVRKSEVSLFKENSRLKHELAESGAEVVSLMFSKEELEITRIVLEAKFDEHNDELIMLRKKSEELTNKLSEQILKTEEFKNLSIHLKSIKDVPREKRELEGPAESLRIAFMKEQYETKLQELNQQLSVSKRHGEDMLIKLQDALDETESRKKSEASHLKKMEELSVKIVELEAELECAVLSLECLKEEKEKLVASIRECEEEKSKIGVELLLIQERLAQNKENCVMGNKRYEGIRGSTNDEVVQNAQILKGVPESEGVDGFPEHVSSDKDDSLLDNSKQLMVVNDKAQHLRSCMEQLDEELEMMKNENALPPSTNSETSSQDLQRELVQLHKVNQELGSIYPNFNDPPENGYALERVLALEVELAEALRERKKPSIQFQSSFLKQHSDEEAVFKSFRDINELIKDMLEVKSRYINMETELKEMHDRYSQLSLQFAEVEGERQKLMMTLKNVRSSRNLVRLNSSSSETLEKDDAL